MTNCVAAALPSPVAAGGIYDKNTYNCKNGQENRVCNILVVEDEKALATCGMSVAACAPLRDGVGRFWEKWQGRCFPKNKVAAAAFRQVIYLQRLAVLPGKVGLQGAGHAVRKVRHICSASYMWNSSFCGSGGPANSALCCAKRTLKPSPCSTGPARETVPPVQLANGGYHLVRLRGGRALEAAYWAQGAPMPIYSGTSGFFAAGGAFGFGARRFRQRRFGPRRAFAEGGRRRAARAGQ